MAKGRLIFSFSLIALLLNSGCVPAKIEHPTTPAPIFSSSKIYSNAYGFELSTVNNILEIKYYKESPTFMGGASKAVSQSMGFYNPEAGILALGPHTMTWPPHSTVTFYKIKNDKFREVLDNIVANPSLYMGNKELDKFFRGNLPYFTYDGKYEGFEIIERIENREGELQKMQTAGLPLKDFFQGTRAYRYDAGREMFIDKFSKLSDILGNGIKLKVHFTPKIINNSGFTVSEQNLITHKRKKNNSTGKYEIEIVPTTEKYKFEIQPTMYEVENNKKEIEITPTVLIQKKKINSYKPNFIASNNELDVVIKNIDAAARQFGFGTDRVYEDLYITIEINNKSTKYVDIGAISFYIYDKIYTFEKKYKLPPLSKQEGIYLKTNEIANLRNVSEKEKLDRHISLEESKNLSCDLGVSVSYTVQGSEQNLFKKSTLSFYDFLKAAQ